MFKYILILLAPLSFVFSHQVQLHELTNHVVYGEDMDEWSKYPVQSDHGSVYTYHEIAGKAINLLELSSNVNKTNGESYTEFCKKMERKVCMRFYEYEQVFI